MKSFIGDTSSPVSAALPVSGRPMALIGVAIRSQLTVSVATSKHSSTAVSDRNAQLPQIRAHLQDAVKSRPASFSRFPGPGEYSGI